ncbi:hypothetical protein HYH02_001217 [Chlamydomonas schloesseri]|uniref:Pherophorin domain-containing protein n=1 Tax=Chlamydomonas schloesseri TaxID=2026947 RepID=A0A835WUF4_9CHLO|nr:hypothetical protein HYH02_001217 [Chlamydomonas schloesseri]|eukprot:KAG2454182.1 hypothetical protein HYH02_001217 [Chlamydomonas schloesseri]
MAAAAASDGLLPVPMAGFLLLLLASSAAAAGVQVSQTRTSGPQLNVEYSIDDGKCSFINVFINLFEQAAAAGGQDAASGASTSSPTTTLQGNVVTFDHCTLAFHNIYFFAQAPTPAELGLSDFTVARSARTARISGSVTPGQCLDSDSGYSSCSGGPVTLTFNVDVTCPDNPITGRNAVTTSSPDGTTRTSYTGTYCDSPPAGITVSVGGSNFTLSPTTATGQWGYTSSGDVSRTQFPVRAK